MFTCRLTNLLGVVPPLSRRAVNGLLASALVASCAPPPEGPGGAIEPSSSVASSGPAASTATAAGSASVDPPRDTPQAPSVLVFSKTSEYRHASIETGTSALQAVADEQGWNFEATEDATRFTDAGLEPFNVLVFLSTTGDVLDAPQQAAMERFIRAGKGYVGIHAASDTEYDWPWYGALVGAYFNAHPPIQAADVLVVNAAHPSTAHLPPSWSRTDEWYGFRAQPGGVNVLLRLDETSYAPGDSAMGEQHPVAWQHEYDGGRAFYTALGHTSESYAEPQFMTHLQEAIRWASSSPTPSAP